jgi:putative peptide zinc metalloprotease protein
VLADGTRVAIADTLTIGRAAGNTIRVDDSTVSRQHARVRVGDGSPEIEDAGSTYGTFVDGRKITRPEKLGDGTLIRLGDAELRVEARRDTAESGRTIVVRPGATLAVPGAGPSRLSQSGFTDVGQVRLRSGWALKRLEADEGDLRYVLRDLRGGRFVRLTEEDAELLRLIDGQRSVHDLVLEAGRRFGPAGVAGLAALLADLGEKGFLESSDAAELPTKRSALARLVSPHDLELPWAGPTFERVYRKGGFVLFTAPALAILAVLAVCGIAAFAYLIAGGHETPFVVARRVGLGGLIFLLGRFIVVVLHEFAHGLTVASFGRRVSRAGIKLVFVFPYAFVDTSEAWFEPRRRRLAVSGAGPASDLVVGGTAALCCLPLASGALRDTLFQLALAAYVGALFNLNPLLDRDGYHMLVDLLREPGLRARSRAWLVRTLSGRPREQGDSSLLAAYAVAGLVWLLLTAAVTIGISRRYYDTLIRLAPRGVVWAVLGLFYLLILVPFIAIIWQAIAARRQDLEVPIGESPA